MVIGVDIDDTMAETSLLVSEYVKEHLDIEYDINSLKKRLKSFIQGIIADDEIKEFALNYLQEIVLRVRPKENVANSLKELKEAGNTIVVITARADKHFKDSYDVTYKWLIDNNIPFDKLICGASEKVDECLEEGVNIMIDDSIDICNNLNTQGIDAILFNSKYNDDEKFNGIRVNSWHEIKDIILNNNKTYVK